MGGGGAPTNLGVALGVENKEFLSSTQTIFLFFFRKGENCFFFLLTLCNVRGVFPKLTIFGAGLGQHTGNTLPNRDPQAFPSAFIRKGEKWDIAKK